MLCYAIPLLVVFEIVWLYISFVAVVSLALPVVCFVFKGWFDRFQSRACFCLEFVFASFCVCHIVTFQKFTSVIVQNLTMRLQRVQVKTPNVIDARPHLFMLPKSSEIFDGPARISYAKLRESWIIVLRNVPVVPFPANTVIPRRQMSKHHRAKLFSVYLRPWTLAHKLGNKDVPFAGDLGLDTSDDCGTVRIQWKAYLQNVWPHAVRTVRNFMANCMAENHRDEDEENSKRGTGMICEMTMADVEKVIEGTEELQQPDMEQSQLSKAVAKSTQLAFALCRLKQSVSRSNKSTLEKAIDRQDQLRCKAPCSQSKNLDRGCICAKL